MGKAELLQITGQTVGAPDRARQGCHAAGPRGGPGEPDKSQLLEVGSKLTNKTVIEALVRGGPC